VDTGVVRLGLTGAYHAELPEVFVGVDEYGTGLGSEHDGVCGGHMACLGLADTFTLHYPEVGRLTAVVEDELVASVKRDEAVALGLSAHDGA
jgi:hypothetical protein